MGFWSDTVFEGVRDAISLVSFVVIVLLISLQKYTRKISRASRSAIDDIRTFFWSWSQVVRFRICHRPSALSDSRTEASASMQNLVLASTRIYFEPVVDVQDLLEYARIWFRACTRTIWYLVVHKCFRNGEMFYTRPFNGFWAARQLPKQR